jgi:hypothetical protein
MEILMKKLMILIGILTMVMVNGSMAQYQCTCTSEPPEWMNYTCGFSTSFQYEVNGIWYTGVVCYCVCQTTQFIWICGVDYFGNPPPPLPFEQYVVQIGDQIARPLALQNCIKNDCTGIDSQWTLYYTPCFKNGLYCAEGGGICMIAYMYRCCWDPPCSTRLLYVDGDPQAIQCPNECSGQCWGGEEYPEPSCW